MIKYIGVCRIIVIWSWMHFRLMYAYIYENIYVCVLVVCVCVLCGVCVLKLKNIYDDWQRISRQENVMSGFFFWWHGVKSIVLVIIYQTWQFSRHHSNIVRHRIILKTGVNMRHVLFIYKQIAMMIIFLIRHCIILQETCIIRSMTFQ